MSEQFGPSVTALRARQSELAEQHGAAAAADRVLAEVLAGAHAAMREGVRRLDAIAEEIETAVLHRERLPVDTPLGAREFQSFLLAKQREIGAVVADARALGNAKGVVLQNLRRQYER